VIKYPHVKKQKKGGGECGDEGDPQESGEAEE
jgi:hypothetical protein